MSAINTIRELLATDDARVFTAPIPGYASVYVLAETEQKAREALIAVMDALDDGAELDELVGVVPAVGALYQTRLKESSWTNAESSFKSCWASIGTAHTTRAIYDAQMGTLRIGFCAESLSFGTVAPCSNPLSSQ